MKKVLAMILALSMVLSVTAAFAEDTTLSIAWWGSQTRHDTTLQLLAMYEEEHPGIKFEAQYMGFSDYFPKLNTLVAADDVYDVFQMGNNFLTYQSVLYPLNEYIESGVIDMTNANGMFLKSGTLNGQCLGIPLGVNAVCLVYDPVMFAEAGVPVPTVNWTWDDYMAASRTLHEKLGVFNVCTQNPFWTGLATYVPQHGENVTAFTDNGDALGYDDDSYLADFFAMNQTLIAEGVQPSPADLVDVSGLESYFIVSGKAAMAWCNSNELVTLLAAAGRDLAIAVPPRQTPDGLSGMHVKPTHHISISINAENKDACAEFINWILNDEEANKLIAGERGTSIMSNIREMMAGELTGVRKMAMEYIDTVSTIVSTGSPREPVGQIEIENELANLFEAIGMMEIAPNEAAAEFRSVADEIFARTVN